MAQQHNCNNPQCCPIYLDNQHIKRRGEQEEVLGSNGQFCAAFYHVHQWDYRDEGRAREYFCLDDNACIIGQRRDEEGNVNRYLQPTETVVAVVKFENRGEIVYDARYTNCKKSQKHAEDFFKDDIEDGELARKVEREENGTITMYLTLQPCNESTSPEGTGGTQAVQSCCKTLQYIFKTILQRKKIGLCVKVTHTNHLGPGRETREPHIQLRENAETGIRDLEKSGVSVERMTDVDWKYLYGMTSANVPLNNNDSRSDLDDTVGNILTNL
jgi:hypothetical protein